MGKKMERFALWLIIPASKFPSVRSGKEPVSFPNPKWPRRRQIQSRGFCAFLSLVTLAILLGVGGTAAYSPWGDGGGRRNHLFLRIPIDPSS